MRLIKPAAHWCARRRHHVALNVGQRLKLLEDQIISFTRELMHFDHFAIRLLDRKNNKLEVVMSRRPAAARR